VLKLVSLASQCAISLGINDYTTSKIADGSITAVVIEQGLKTNKRGAKHDWLL
jgi:hypothetical protein